MLTSPEKVNMSGLKWLDAEVEQAKAVKQARKAKQVKAVKQIEEVEQIEESSPE